MDAYEIREIVDRWTIPIAASPGMPESPVPPVAMHAQGACIFDANGKRHLDFGSGPAAAILGHNHPRYIDAVKRRLHAIGDGAFLDADALELHRKLGQTLTPPLQKSLLLPYREAALQAAMDIARIATGGATDDAMRFGHALSGADASSLQDSFELALSHCAAGPAALIMEPFIGHENLPAPQGHIRTLRRLCHQHGMLFIMDESATGFGRTGRMWAHQHDEIVPDIIIVSARFGAGLSVSAVCTAPDIAQRAGAADMQPAPWRDPVACAAAVAGIDIVHEEKLAARAAAIGHQLQTRLAAMALANPIIATIRGRGAMYAIELAAAPGTPAAANARTASAAVQACRNKGLLLPAPCEDKRGNAIHIAPPLVTTSAEIDEGMEILANVLQNIGQSNTKSNTKSNATTTNSNDGNNSGSITNIITDSITNTHIGNAHRIAPHPAMQANIAA